MRSVVLLVTGVLCCLIAIEAAYVKYAGVNLCGAEFSHTQLPGEYGQNYKYPTFEEIDYFTQQRINFNIFRIPFTWERLQQAPYQNFIRTELNRLDAVVNYATLAKGAHVIIDVHNYAKYYAGFVGINQTQDGLLDLWKKLAYHYKNNDRVIFGIMNEPYAIDALVWASIANATIHAIRSTGATNLVLVPGSYWTRAHSWTQPFDGTGTPNGEAFNGFVDPGNNMAFEVHQYLDSNSAGANETCVSATIGKDRLVDFTGWLRDHGYQGFLGEFGGGSDPTCMSAINDMCQYMQDNDDVWLGWAYWAAGPLWPADYFTLLEPTATADRPQLAVLTPYVQPPPFGATTGISVSTGINTGAPSNPTRPAYGGTSLSGAEINWDEHFPGRLDADYYFPANESVDYYASKGFNIFRIPFRWERTQKSLNSPLAQEDLAKLHALVSHTTIANKNHIILTPYNGGRYFGSAIGDPLSSVKASDFAAFWAMMANEFKNNTRVMFGLMNAPYDIDATLWTQTINLTIKAIRDTNASNLILVPGVEFSHAQSWSDITYGTSNAAALLNIRDPLNNMVFEFQTWMDADGSGTTTSGSYVCITPTIGADRLKLVTNWLRANNQIGFLGAFGTGVDPVCVQAIDNMMTFIDNNTDVWVGWTYFTGGAGSQNLWSSIWPLNDGSDTPQMEALEAHIPIPNVATTSTTGNGQVVTTGLASASDTDSSTAEANSSGTTESATSATGIVTESSTISTASTASSTSSVSSASTSVGSSASSTSTAADSTIGSTTSTVSPVASTASSTPTRVVLMTMVLLIMMMLPGFL